MSQYAPKFDARTVSNTEYVRRAVQDEPYGNRTLVQELANASGDRVEARRVARKMRELVKSGLLRFQAFPSRKPPGTPRKRKAKGAATKPAA